VATPADLITDKTRTPFNIGRGIELRGFQLQEVQPLAEGLAQKAQNDQEVLKEILAWTGGQPFLTQKLCKLVLTCGDPPQPPLKKGEQKLVKQLVRSRIIENWEAQDEPEHLKTIRDRLLRIGNRTALLLGLYKQILQYGEVAVEDSPEWMELQLSGLVVKQRGKLRVYNRIYAAVFDQIWVDRVLADLRPYGEPLAAWLASDYQNTSHLLRGQALEHAKKWAEDKSLSTEDYKFLYASQELESREFQKVFDENQKAFKERQKLFEDTEKRLKSTMYRYMTQELAEELLRLDDAKLGGDRQEVSVLFSDIRSYTSLTETLSAEEVVGMLNEYFELMVEAVFQHKGTLDKYIGDALMAVFGSPLPLTDHAWRAVQTAVEMRKRLAGLNSRRLADGKEIIKIGIGINSDSVISGNIGSSKRMEFTAIGDGVNLGSRLESATKQYGCDIIISQYTFQRCADLIWHRELDWIHVTGKTEAVKIYELVELRSEQISPEKQEIIELYHKGREYYLNRKFTRAMGEFGTILEEIDKNDKAAILHLERCQHFLSEPPPDEWDGVWTLT
jgi:class 3 adenylate cyclase